MPSEPDTVWQHDHKGLFLNIVFYANIVNSAYFPQVFMGYRLIKKELEKCINCLIYGLLFFAVFAII